MFRILIVDDEKIILNGLRFMIQEKLELPFSVDIAVAVSVRQALEIMKKFEPDLILTDIRMPLVDGFELIRQVREKDASKSIVILTSHADFQYAQQAIRYHVTDFILKPIDKQALKDTIERIYEQKEAREKSFLQSALMEVGNMMMYDLSIRDLTSDPELIRQLFPHIYFTVIAVAFPRMDTSWTGILEEVLLGCYDKCYCFLQPENSQMIAICNHDQMQYQMKAVALEQKLIKATGCDRAWVGISICADNFMSLHNLYLNAVQRIFYLKHFGKNSEMTEIALLTYHDCIRVFLEEDVAHAGRLLQSYLKKTEVVTDQYILPEKIYQGFFYNIMLYLETNKIPVPEKMVEDAVPVREYQELVPCIMERLIRLKEQIKSGKFIKEDALVKKLLEYIKQHCREDISLESLAAETGQNLSYICTIFKKKVGMTCMECIHKERLQMAKKLLLETDYTMEHIADEVGYNSASQFARVFRRYENTSPSAFREAADK